jgi:2-desacetyl-2-hydroxyethyl bacteriochlorophyllide A dehydrogenase
MKALVYTQPEHVEVRDVPIPKLKEKYARIKVLYCGVCGSDISIFTGKHPRAKAPLILGHEFVGIVDEIGENKKGIKKGDRVVVYPLLSCGECFACKTGSPHVCKKLGLIGIDIDGGMAEYVNAHQDVLFKVDDSISDRAAALIEPLAVVVRTMHQIGFSALDTVVVSGAGPIGALTAIVLQDIGASRIIVSDIDEARLKVCGELGLETVNLNKQNLIEYVNKTTDGVGVDIVFECSAAKSAILDMTKIVRIGGRICMTSIPKHPVPVDLCDMNFKEIFMIGSRVYTAREFGQAVEYAKKLQPQLEKVLTHIYKWDRADTVFQAIKDPNINTVKVVVDCRNE